MISATYACLDTCFRVENATASASGARRAALYRLGRSESDVLFHWGSYEYGPRVTFLDSFVRINRVSLMCC